MWSWPLRPDLLHMRWCQPGLYRPVDCGPLPPRPAPDGSSQIVRRGSASAGPVRSWSRACGGWRG